jgi:hypothetical protein
MLGISFWPSEKMAILDHTIKKVTMTITGTVRKDGNDNDESIDFGFNIINHL